MKKPEIMNKPKFNPNEAFSSSPAAQGEKPKFDASKPFEESSSGINFGGPRAESLFDAVINEFTKDPGVDAKAMFKTFGYPAGLVRTGIKELLTRTATSGNKGSGDIGAALKGDAPSTGQSLIAAGVPSMLATPAGFIADVATDPMASFIGPARGGLPKAAIAKEAVQPPMQSPLGTTRFG